MPVYNQTNIKAKVREFESSIKINFLEDEIPKKFAVYLHWLHNY